MFDIVEKQDKRKQRIELTEYCREFCKKNDEASANIIGKMFEGILQEQLIITIQTIMQMENNLTNLE